jgi:peptidyl-prolyl cis-trans isomerase B (cyclophilin B)
MTERVEQSRKRKKRTAIIGAAGALLLVAGGTIWLVSALTDSSAPTTDKAATTPASCVWEQAPARTPDQPNTIKDVGMPPTGTEPHSGTQVMTISTNFGDVEITMDLAKAPCTAASFAHLSSKQFFDGTKCHRMFPGMLQCGDPSAKGPGYRETDGTGGPSYGFAIENLPDVINPADAYPVGTVALANSGEGSLNGSQFFIIFDAVQLQSSYTVLGHVTKGLDVVKTATAKGHDGAFDPSPGGGHPKEEILIKTLKVGAPVAG